MTKLLAMTLKMKHSPHHSNWDFNGFLNAGVGQEAAGGETVHLLGCAFLQGLSLLGTWGLGVGGAPKNVWGEYPNNLEKIDVLKANLPILSLLQHPRRWDTVGILMCRRETLLLELPQPLPTTQNVYNLVHKKVQGWLHDGWMAMGALERNSKSPFRWRSKLLWHIG
jgi:hypothetical protein